MIACASCSHVLKILESATVMEVRMAEVNRPDVIAGRELTNTFDIDAINYYDLQIITHDFIKNVLLSSPCIHNQIPDTLIQLAENTCRKILLNLSNVLSDEEQFTDTLENYATVSDILLPTFFNVYKLCGEELCKKYLEFLVNHPTLRKYRIEHV